MIFNDSNIIFEKKKLAILLAFRDAFEELLQFAPHMNKFLNEQKIPHHIFVINQADKYRFNKGALLNIGFLYAKEKFDYLVIHDIDLLPANKNLSYEYPIDGVRHGISPGQHPEKGRVGVTATFLQKTFYYSF